MSSIPSGPVSGSSGLSGASLANSLDPSGTIAALLAQADAIEGSLATFAALINKQTAELNQVNGVIGDLSNLASECNGANGTVNTSSLQGEMKSLGIDLPNPANASQINDALDTAHSAQSSLSSQNSEAQEEMQLEMSSLNTLLQEASSITAALTQTSQDIVKNMG